MFRNYFKVAARNLSGKKFYTVINIFGLVIGFISCMYIFLYVQYELSYDAFHENKDRIYRIVTTFTEGGAESNYPSTQIPLATELEANYSEVEHAVRFIEMGRKLIENPESNTGSYEEDFYFVDPAVFDVFNFTLLKGNPASALSLPNTAVVTQKLAKRYFGEEDPMGKTLRNESDGTIYLITGIIKDIPANSHLQFDALVSYATFPEEQFSDWGGWFPSTYLLLKKEVNPQRIEEVLAKINNEKVVPIFENFGITINYWLQPVTDIHLKSNFGDDGAKGGDIAYIYIFIAVAFFMLLIACLNYMNLSTAHAIRRAKEVGIRKTLGSVRSQIIQQFLVESTFIVLITFLLSLFVIIWLLPFLNEFSGKAIPISYLFQEQSLAFMLVILLLAGFGGGSYPAFYLSKFNPGVVLKGNLKAGGGNQILRKALVVVQFSLSVGMLVSTLFVYDQLQYLRKKDLGFEKDQLITITLPDSTTQLNYPMLYNHLKEHVNILEISTSSSKPGDDVFYSIMDVDSPEGKVDRGVNYYYADYDFINTMSIKIVEGRNFSREFVTDTAAALINESMVAKMQWEDPIGKKFRFKGNETQGPGPTYKVVGVIQDYHQQSLYSPIEPLAIFLRESNYFLNVKVAPQDVKGTIAVMEKVWKDVNPGRPFGFNFIDQDIQTQYLADKKRGQIFTLFSVLTMLIACLGLLGLAAYTTEQRTKEIGIRKVMGASLLSILKLIYNDFFLLITMAILIAFPVSYFYIHDWLQTFAYKTEITWGTFGISAILMIIVTLGAVSFHVFRAAIVNPVDSLRNE